MRVKTWRILDRGAVPEGASTIMYPCRCGYEAMLPIAGRPIAMGLGRQSDGWVIFDPGTNALPTTIQCRRCRRILTNEDRRVR